MSLVQTLWERLTEEGETVQLEAKEARGGIGDSIMQTVCAFANEPDLGGGYILLGVQELTEPETYYVPIGLENTDQLLNNLQSNCRDQFDSSIAISAEIGEVEGRTLIAITVHESPNAHKPVRFKGKIDPGSKTRRKTGVWLRGVNGDFECTDAELEPLWRARNNQTYDAMLLSRSDWSDLDPDMIELYRKMRADKDPLAEELQGSDEEMLEALNLVERQDKVFIPTLAGLLLLGKPLALRKHCPALRTDYIRVPGSEWMILNTGTTR